jgi:hypothetical protein
MPEEITTEHAENTESACHGDAPVCYRMIVRRKPRSYHERLWTDELGEQDVTDDQFSRNVVR